MHNIEVFLFVREMDARRYDYSSFRYRTSENSPINTLIFLRRNL